jgi:hypothetical protein
MAFSELYSVFCTFLKIISAKKTTIQRQIKPENLMFIRLGAQLISWGFKLK